MFINFRSPMFVFTCILLFSGCTTTAPVESVEQVTSHEAPGLTKAQVFNKTRQWFTKFFVNEESTIDSENSNSGVITGSGVAHIGGIMIDKSAKYKIKVEAKDNGFTASTKVLEFINADINGSYAPSDVNQDRINLTNRKISGVVMSLARYVKESATDDSY
jgi:hypothetical protein